LATGVVLDPVQLEIEMTALAEYNVKFKGRFFIDQRVSIVLPLHKLLDKRKEELAGDKKIGTTGRGIGPCYADSVSRVAIKIYDLYNKQKLKAKLRYIYKYHNVELHVIELLKLVEELHGFGQKMKSYFVNLPYKMDTWIKEGKNILYEGAQGSLLDVYFGTYPYVTSSHTIAGGIAASIGVSPKKVDELIGVYKSYFSRVGSGPFPTELFDLTGDRIRKQGNEYGSTTGRPRRIGWFDAVSAKYTTMINGIDTAALTVLDVLTGFETLKICVGYKIGEKTVKEFPANSAILERVEPVYIELPGWENDITWCKKWDELPHKAKKYVKTIEELIEVPVKLISVGPNRNQIIYV
jgi:adenylosuccinate synthase